MWKTFMFPVAFCIAATPAVAAPQCAPRQTILDILEQQFKEHPIAIGVNRYGRLLEILASERGDTWTIVLTSPEGVTCILDTGEAWHQTRLDKIDPEA